MKNTLGGYRILCWEVFSFTSLMIFHCLLAVFLSFWFWDCSFKGKTSFPLVYFKIFSCSLFFSSWTGMHLGMVFFIFIYSWSLQHFSGFLSLVWKVLPLFLQRLLLLYSLLFWLDPFTTSHVFAVHFCFSTLTLHGPACMFSSDILLHCPFSCV